MPLVTVSDAGPGTRIRPPKIKFCGFTREADVRAAAEIGIDAIGLNLARGPRKITLDHAATLSRAIPPWIASVALFVDATESDILAAMSATRCTVVQLHGDEATELAESLRSRFPVIKAFAVRDSASVQRIHGYPADSYLLDAAVPGQVGGTGVAWDHRLVAGIRFDRPWMLAGGLRPDNAAAAALSGADALDVSSGIEASPGIKDPGKMSAFVHAVRSQG